MNIAGGDLWLNTVSYTSLQLGLLLFGNLAWTLLYFVVLRNIWRHGVVEIPAAAVASNLAWVTVWGLFNRTDLGLLFVWANRGAVVLEVAVFGYVLLQGAQHVRTPEVRRWFKPGLIASYLCWLVMLYFYVFEKYDATNGIISGFTVALFMSALYVLVELSEIDAAQYSLVAGWCKLLGNGGAAIFCVLAYPANRYLLSLCAVTIALDVTYLLLFRLRGALAPRARAPA